METVRKEPSYPTYEEWKVTFKKQYTQEENEKRKRIWEKSLAAIKVHNQGFIAKDYSYSNQLTRFCDQEAHELQWMNSCCPMIAAYGAGAEVDLGVNLLVWEVASKANPEYVDWRDKECVTKVGQQSPLRACWIFAAVGAVESRNKIVNGELVDLSVQQLVDCIESGGRSGNVKHAFEYIEKNGCIREENYKRGSPKKLKSGPCLAKEMPIEVHIDDFKELYGEHALEAAVAEGPVAVQLTIHDKAEFRRQQNFDEIFYDTKESNSGQPFLHAMLCVGYGRDPAKPNGEDKYWIVKNSWGDENPGDEKNSGFRKIAKNRDNNCGIASDAWYPIIRKKQQEGQ